MPDGKGPGWWTSLEITSDYLRESLLAFAIEHYDAEHVAVRLGIQGAVFRRVDMHRLLKDAIAKIECTRPEQHTTGEPCAACLADVLDEVC